MNFYSATFFFSFISLSGLLFAKSWEIGHGRINFLEKLSAKFDPLVHKIIAYFRCVAVSGSSEGFRVVFSKLVVSLAKVLFVVKNFFSKVAAHLYHVGRKVEKGESTKSAVSFFLKAVLGFKENDKVNENDGETRITDRE